MWDSFQTENRRTRSLWRDSDASVKDAFVFRCIRFCADCCCPPWLRSESATILIVLTIVGVLSSIQAFTIQICGKGFATSRNLAAQSVSTAWAPVVQTCVAVVYVVVCLFLVRQFAKPAAGSGLSEMRAVLNGIRLPGFLHASTLVVKAVGCSLATGGAGLFVGFLGPFVHVCVILCSNVLSICPWFWKLPRSEKLRKELLTAACASGVSSVYNCPLGGVVFSIESTSNFFLISNLWKSLYASTIGMVLSYFLRIQFPGVLPEIRSDFDENSYRTEELWCFCVVGLICGMVSIAVIKLYVLTFKFFARFGNSIYILVVITTIFSSFVWFIFPLTRYRDISSVVNKLLSPQDPDMGEFDVLPGLLLLSFMLLIIQSLCMACPVPSGLFLPELCLGAVIGRCVGHVVQDFIYAQANPAAYAAICGTALIIGVTSSLSTSIIICEAMGDINLSAPMLIAGIIARGLRTLFTESFYDCQVGLKHIPTIDPNNASDVVLAKDLMIPFESMTKLTLESTLGELWDILSDEGRILYSYPVISSPEDRVLCGVAKRYDLLQSATAGRCCATADDLKNDQGAPGLPDQWRGQRVRFRGLESGDAALEVFPDEPRNASLSASEESEKGSPPPSPSVDGPISDTHSSDSVFIEYSILDNPSSEVSPPAVWISDPPVLLSARASSEIVWEIFSMADVDHAYVTDFGRLCGIITRRSLLTQGFKIRQSLSGLG
eukprot:ANDGO_01106.mRNA.1 Chloride channel protein F